MFSNDYNNLEHHIPIYVYIMPIKRIDLKQFLRLYVYSYLQLENQ